MGHEPAEQALATGRKARATGNNVPGAVLTGGGAFAGTVGLLLAIAHYTRPQ